MAIVGYNTLRGLTPRPLQPLRDRLEASRLGARLAGGVLWSAYGAALSRALALVASIVTARLLGADGFGGYGIIQSTVALFATVGSLCMGLTAAKFVAEYREKDPARAGRIIGMSSLVSWVSGSIMALALAVLAPWLAEHTLAAPQLTDALRFGALLSLLSVVQEAQTGALSGFEAFKRRAMVQVVGGLVCFPMAVAGVYWFGLVGAVWALIVSQAVLVFLNYRAIRQVAARAGAAIGWGGIRQELPLLWSFSVPSFLGALIYMPSIWLANLIIVNGPNGYAEMGIFSAADRWRTAILFFPTLLGSVTLPILSNLRAPSASQQYYKVLWTNLTISFLFAFAAATPVAVLSPWIMASYGPEFGGGKVVLVVLGFVSVITATFWIIGNAIASEGRMWFLLALNAIWATLLVSGCWFFRPHGGLALAFSYLVADGVRLTIVLIDLRRRQGRVVRPDDSLAAVPC